MATFSMTARDLISQALKAAGVLGVGQSLGAEDAEDARIQLNMMIGTWARKRWLIMHLLDLSCVSYGAVEYTIGPKGDFDLSFRPDRIESAFYRQVNLSAPNQPDVMLDILQSREDYNQIALKELQSVPSYLFYDSGWPTGKLYFWPNPLPDIYEMHISVKAVLDGYDNLTDTIDLPPEYYAALFHNLTIRLAPIFGKEPKQSTVALARDALNVIRGANFQIPRLMMPKALVQPGVYNPYSDRVR